MKRRYFGTDGVRGKVGSAPITPDFVMKLGQAAGRVLKRHNPTGRASVLIGKDTRVSGYMLEAALQAGFSSAGVDVVLCGPIPTPAVAYLTRAQRLDAGVVISASHNPYDDNGIKFFSAAGQKLPDSWEVEIEEEIDEGFACVPSAELGKARRLDDASGRYIEFCKSTIDSDIDLKGLKIFVDCANGAAYHVAPDADGRVYTGDELLYVMIRDRLSKGMVAGVAGTLMTNYGLEKRLNELGIPFGRAKVGDRYVLEMLLERGWILGGETSGHLLALDRQTTGDGIVSALQVLSAMRHTGKSLAELTADLQLMPQVLINRQFTRGADWHSLPQFAATVTEAERAVAGRGRVLIRPSGTEPVLRIMVEADDKAFAEQLAEKMAQALENNLLSKTSK